MKIKMVPAIVGIVIIFLVIFAIWFFAFKNIVMPIGKILERPANYVNKIITIKGTVSERLSLLAFKYYVLKDDTGEIKVITKRPLPAVNAKITVKGKIKTAYAIGSLQEIVFVEE